MTITKTMQGAYSVSKIVKGHLITKTYFGYTKREALNEFKYYVKGLL